MLVIIVWCWKTCKLWKLFCGSKIIWSHDQELNVEPWESEQKIWECKTRDANISDAVEILVNDGNDDDRDIADDDKDQQEGLRTKVPSWHREYPRRGTTFSNVRSSTHPRLIWAEIFLVTCALNYFPCYPSQWLESCWHCPPMLWQKLSRWLLNQFSTSMPTGYNEGHVH